MEKGTITKQGHSKQTFANRKYHKLSQRVSAKEL